MGRAYEVRKASIQKTGAAKGKVYTTFAKEIYLAAKKGSPNPEANVTLKDIDAVTPTYGPGLVGALLVGVSYAKAVAFANNLPLVGVNHIAGHIAAKTLWAVLMQNGPFAGKRLRNFIQNCPVCLDKS